MTCFRILTLQFLRRKCVAIVVLNGVESFVSLVDMCDRKKNEKKITMRQELTTWHDWERPHKGKVTKCGLTKSG